MKKCIYVFSACLLAVTIMYLSRSHWLPLIAKYLVVNDAPVASDVIIVPSGNAENLRIEYAVKLYKLGYARKILLSGRLSLQKETGMNLGKIYMQSLGVPKQDILTEDESASTYENAVFSNTIIKQDGFKSVILVTYPIHTRRTKRIFKKNLPGDIRIIVCCDKNGLDVNRWWKDYNSKRDVLYECFGYAWNVVFGT